MERSPNYYIMNNRLRSMLLLDAYKGLTEFIMLKRKKGNLTRFVMNDSWGTSSQPHVLNEGSKTE